MIFGIGVDVVCIDRIRNSIAQYGNQFLFRVFSEEERKYCESKSEELKPMHYAARFAAKEAFVKAIGTGIGAQFSFLDIQVLREISGKPILQFHEKHSELMHTFICFLSISHTAEEAIAFVVVEKK